MKIENRCSSKDVTTETVAQNRQNVQIRKNEKKGGGAGKAHTRGNRSAPPRVWALPAPPFFLASPQAHHPRYARTALRLPAMPVTRLTPPNLNMTIQISQKIDLCNRNKAQFRRRRHPTGYPRRGSFPQAENRRKERRAFRAIKGKRRDPPGTLPGGNSQPLFKDHS